MFRKITGVAMYGLAALWLFPLVWAFWTAFRPRELAILLLAAGGEPPRQRARDQQADLAGAELRRRVLDRLASIDPEPEEIAASLGAIVAEIGEPTGPTRAIASSVLQEWDSARNVAGFWSWLVSEAVAAGRSDGRRRKRHGDGDVA